MANSRNFEDALPLLVLIILSIPLSISATEEVLLNTCGVKEQVGNGIVLTIIYGQCLQRRRSFFLGTFWTNLKELFNFLTTKVFRTYS